MTTGHVFIAVSLDGFIARKDHAIDWLEGQGTTTEEHGYTQFVNSVDGIIFGRKTYEVILDLTSDAEWPYPKPVIVLSRTLTNSDIPTHLTDKVTVTDQTPAELLQSLDQQGWKRAYIDGGITIQSFLNEGLIEDLIITTLPILIGEGIPLFGTIPEDIHLELIKLNQYPSGLAQSHYRVLKRSS
ncbi:MAG: dihydrofolate reductase [Chloroflexi bacterium]|nr:dihydrofolate reductase [Chloroflexota bacterium]